MPITTTRLSARLLAAGLLLGAAAPALAQTAPSTASATVSATVSPGAADAALIRIVDGQQRPAEDKARDVHRHPAESLAFWGLKPGAAILEVGPGAGWWTRILAAYAKQTGGRYMATLPDLDNPKLSEGAKKSRASFEAQFGDPALYGKVEGLSFGPQSKPLPADSADFVLLARALHNWLGNPEAADKMLKDLFVATKPGGILAVEQHRAAPGTVFDAGKSTGYVAEDEVVRLVEKAGFKLEAKSEINANPKDTRDHPFGVWTLPPVRQSSADGKPDPAFDHGKYDAIGESDRMTLRFRKPN